MKNPPPRPRKDLVSRRYQLRQRRRETGTNQEILVDSVVRAWNDPENGRQVLTEGGHLVESEKSPGETIRLMRRGLVYEEV